MKISQFKNHLYNHVFDILDGECVHSSPCGVGGDRAGEIATKIAELAEELLSEKIPKTTNRQFKLALRQDGNFKNSTNRLSYALRAIRSEYESRRISAGQFNSLSHWAGENFSDSVPSTQR